MVINQLNTVDIILLICGLCLGIVTLFIANHLRKISFPVFFLGIIGLLVALLMGYLAAIPLRNLPELYGKWVPIIINILVTFSAFYLFIAQSQRLVNFIKINFAKKIGWDNVAHKDSIILDTSILIDGRVEKIVETNFVFGDLIVPRFVLHELQKIADSNDPIKRAKGRRGMDTLANLQKKKNIHIEIIDLDENGKGTVDERLVKQAKQKKVWLMTLDYNLLQVAKIQKVKALNLNDLVLALRPNLLPGDELSIMVMQKGKEASQGIGYLPDGTMVVIERGSKLIGKIVNTKVNRIFQATSGQVVFVEPLENEEDKNNSNYKSSRLKNS